MIILLPNEYDGLPLLEDYVTTTDFTKEILDEIKFTKVKVEIPKFKVEDTFEMKAFLMEVIHIRFLTNFSGNHIY
jgi:serine protease inhibitor